MNWSQVSRCGLFHFPLKLHNHSFSILLRDSQCFLSRNCYFVPDSTRNRYHSQASCNNKQVIRYNILNNLLLRNFRYLNQTVTSCSVPFTCHRSLSSIPQGTTEKPHQDRETSNAVKVPTENGEVKTSEESQLKDASVTEVTGEAAPPETAKKLSLYQRFKKTYKEHGKVLIVVHLLTSAVWFGSFYSIARCGVDVVSFMEKMNFSEKIISPFRSGGLGDVAVAYLMYKLATPARYTVTIGGTNLAIKYLRKEGKIPHVAQEDTIRSLYKEGKEDFKRRSDVHFRRLKRRHKIKPRISTKDKH